MDGTGTVVVTSPTVSLGSTSLTDVTWVDSTTLTATVPWAMDPGVYALTVVNPDGGTGSLAGAFTVTQGIGEWNGGDLFGGPVPQLLLKPGDPNTLYAWPMTSACSAAVTPASTGASSAAMSRAIPISSSIHCIRAGCIPTSTRARGTAVCTARRTRVTPGPAWCPGRGSSSTPTTARCSPRPTTLRSSFFAPPPSTLVPSPTSDLRHPRLRTGQVHGRRGVVAGRGGHGRRLRSRRRVSSHRPLADGAGDHRPVRSTDPPTGATTGARSSNLRSAA